MQIRHGHAIGKSCGRRPGSFAGPEDGWITLWALGLDGLRMSDGQEDSGAMELPVSKEEKTPGGKFLLGRIDNWQSVSGGGFHTVALRSDGTLWTWGLNSSGQVGDGTNTSRHTRLPSPQVPLMAGSDGRCGILWPSGRTALCGLGATINLANSVTERSIRRTARCKWAISNAWRALSTGGGGSASLTLAHRCHRWPCGVLGIAAKPGSAPRINFTMPGPVLPGGTAQTLSFRRSPSPPTTCPRRCPPPPVTACR